MRLKKILPMLVWILLVLSLSLAYPGITTTFDDGTNTGNITFNSDLSLFNITKFINIPLGVNVTNAYFYLDGYQGGETYQVERTFEDGNTSIFSGGTVAILGCGGTCIDGSSLIVSETSTAGTQSTYDFQHDIDSYLNLTVFVRAGATGSPLLRLYSSDGSEIQRIQYVPGLSRWEAGTGGTVLASGQGYNKVSMITSLTNNTVVYYMNDTYITTLNYLNNKDNIRTVRFSGWGGNFLLDNMTYTTFGSESPISGSQYPTNVTVYVNNQEAFNFGAGNGSSLDHKVLVNITSLLSFIDVYPTPIAFISNTTGILEYSDVFVEDSSRNFTFFFYDEQDGSVFDSNATNSTTLSISCSDSYNEYDVSVGELSVGVDCEDYDLLKLDVTQNDEVNYYRTFTLSPNINTTPTINWFMVNLNNRSVVEIILKLNDLSGGAWEQSTVSIGRVITNKGFNPIIEQEFDIEGKAYLYLMKDQNYNLTITNDEGDVFRGNIIADQAEVKVINLPSLEYFPDENYRDSIQINDTLSVNDSTYAFHYDDKLGHTTYVNFTMRYASNQSIIASSDFYGTNVTFIVSSIMANETYVVEYWADHSRLGWINGNLIINTFEDFGEHAGFTQEEWENGIRVVIYLFLIIMLVAGSPVNAYITNGVVFILMIVFKSIGWLNWVDVGLLVFIGLFVGLSFYRKAEESPT